MKLQVETTFDFGKLANKTREIIDQFREETIVGEAGAMKKRISAGKTIAGKMDKLEDSTVETRKLRGISGKTPLKATGKLLASINAKKTGVSALEYGSFHNKKFVTQNKPMIPDSPIYSGKARKGSKKFNFAGKTVPARQWIHTDETFKYNKKIINKFFKSIFKALKK